MVDMQRIYRVMDLRRIRGVEERYALHRSGKMDADKLQGDWEQIDEHERLIEKYHIGE